MKQFYSLSKYPGTSGYYFYNSLFKLHHINAEYTPLGVAETEFQNTFQNLINHGASGISVSMPYKQRVIEHLDDKSPEVVAYNSCNTVVLVDGKYVGYNTDINGVIAVSAALLPSDRILILGDGCMGKMFAKYLSNNHLTICSRSQGTWQKRHEPCDVLINCTAFGTINIDSPINYLSEGTRLVIDLAIRPGVLKTQALRAGAEYIGGDVFYMHQFIKQYELYTGLKVTTADFEQVSKNR